MQNGQQIQVRIDETPDVKSTCVAVRKPKQGTASYARASLTQYCPPQIPITERSAISSYGYNGYRSYAAVSTGARKSPANKNNCGTPS
jgi:hypothetical protein